MKQSGIALLVVLSSILLMSSIVSITYLYMSDMLYFVGDSQKKQDEKQLLLGSEAVFFNDITKEMLIGRDFRHIYSGLLASPTTIRVNNRDVHYSLIDRTNCFNINTLYGYFNNNNGYYPWLILKNILEFNNVTSSVVNKMMRMFIKYPLSRPNLDSVDKEFLAIEQDFLMGKSIDKLLNISHESLSSIAPLFCSRNDNTLLVNINMLDANNSQLVQVIFMNEITEKDMYKAMSSKPTQGWMTVDSFFESLANNLEVDIDKINKLRKIKMLKFSHDEYYFSSSFKGDKGNSQLMSLFHVKGNEITVLQRRFFL